MSGPGTSTGRSPLAVAAASIDRARRRFLGTAAMTLAAPFVASGEGTSASRQDTNGRIAGAPAPVFDAIKQINAGVLNVGYADVGPRRGRAVVLLHGWPYDIHSYVDVAPLLASAGYR
jgi:hypothetical protein